jgi:hypothetical protein
MPKPQWDKKTISTYIKKEQKELWQRIAKSERKPIADFIRDRVQSTISNHNGKICVWLDVSKELQAKAEAENIHLDELIQYHVQRISKDDKENELKWEQSANSSDVEALKATIAELQRQIEVLSIENNSLRHRGTVSDSNEIYKVLDKEKFLSLEKIAVLLNRGDGDAAIQELQDEIEETMFNIGMIEFKLGSGGGYRYNPDIEPVEREYSSKKIKIEV